MAMICGMGREGKITEENRTERKIRERMGRVIIFSFSNHMRNVFSSERLRRVSLKYKRKGTNIPLGHTNPGMQPTHSECNA